MSTPLTLKLSYGSDLRRFNIISGLSLAGLKNKASEAWSNKLGGAEGVNKLIFKVNTTQQSMHINNCDSSVIPYSDSLGLNFSSYSFNLKRLW